ncbi:extracellular solute-binding protein [Paenibacillus spongiae]|uniref:Extracellular solute-binding protein n=1 Tax=Paenibacillus spongiae TaxID=2909671 RepID=A0ABY5SII1_9BACL|nr:extracellular solute-binding protein [Paenibacillus spongiae]UVI33383.1 extracellular solute-binding protein [Paenibacillus spongiae]
MSRGVWKGTKSILALILTMSVVLAGCGGADTGSESPANSKGNDTSSTDKPKDVTLTVMANWPGADAFISKDQENNPIAKAIKEKTGVTLKIEVTKVSTVEKLNTMFATGDLPDIYVGPAWGEELNIMKKAAEQGQILDITTQLSKYPTLTMNVSQEFMPKDIYDAYHSFGDKQYFMYNRYPAKPEDIKDWLHGLFVRKDIADKVVVDPKSVHTPEQLYDFLKKIKDANIQEKGKTIIPLGSNANGWALYLTNKMFYNFTTFKIENGIAQHSFMTPEVEKQILYQRKLIAEGLIDPEAYTQTTAIADEKALQGRYAVIAAHLYNLINRKVISTVEKDNPNAVYVPLGPLNNADGDPYRHTVKAEGDNLVALMKGNKDPEASMRVLNFLASDEGWMLANYGVEGVHYEMADGKPVAKKEWIDKEKDASGTLLQEGFGNQSIYTFMAGQNRTFSLAGGPYGHQFDETYKRITEAQKIMRKNGVELLQGRNPVLTEFTGFDKLKPLLEQVDAVTKQAYYAKTEDEAMGLINNLRGELEKAGIHELEKWAAEEDKKSPFTKYKTE